ncbi:MAG: hypothetical protein Q9196_001235 [Gyalolechia fulgens]
MSVCARFYIRVVIQKQFSSDDGILLFGIACLIVAIGLLLNYIDEMYIVETAESGNLVSVSLPANYIEQSFDYQKMATIALVLTWCSIVSVKFSYLFLFRRLINRLPGMMAYWWIAAVYNGLISVYGAVVYVVACPEYYTLRALRCVFGSGLHRALALSQSQMVLDIVGDLLIIYIPFRLIWSVKVRWTQKIALACTLCLTILTIMCTIVRIAGIHTGRRIRSIDSVWETYWQYIAANIALSMTAATAFRTVFITWNADPHRAADRPGVRSNETLYAKSQKLYRFVISTILPFRRFKKSAGDSGARRGSGGWNDNPVELRPQFPRATLTGMRTFIGQQGKLQWHRDSQMMQSVSRDEDRDDWPLSAAS